MGPWEERLMWGQDERSSEVGSGEGGGPGNMDETEVLSRTVTGSRVLRRVSRARTRLEFSVMYAIVLEGFRESSSESNDIREDETPSQTCMRW